MNSYLRDKNFLNKIIRQNNTEQFIKITVLNMYEKPVATLEGVATGGNLNIDGRSSLRRTCNCSFVLTKGDDIVSNLQILLSVQRKIKLEIGLSNHTPEYREEDVIWFPLGLFIIGYPSISHSVSGTNISLQLKDKMCLLNGDCGGTLTSAVSFHEYEYLDEMGEVVIERPTIFHIIQELVHHFGGEQMGRIIISDIPDRIKRVVKWTGSYPLYKVPFETGDEATQGIDAEYHYTLQTELPKINQKYTMITNGQDLGYVYEDFTYPGELIGNVGETVCSILDKIKNLLGNFEYFYDVEGNFIFREIKNYLNASHSKTEMDTNDKLNAGNLNYFMSRGKGKDIFSFDDNKLLISCARNPQYNLIKNDFTVWGMRKNSLGQSFPIRYHLTIDKKPETGHTFKYIYFYDEHDNLLKGKAIVYVPYSKDNSKFIGSQNLIYCLENFDGEIEYVVYRKNDKNDVFDKKNILVCLEKPPSKDSNNLKKNIYYKYRDENNKEKIIFYDGKSQREVEKDKKNFYEIKDFNLTSYTTKEGEWRQEIYFSGLESEPLGRYENPYFIELKNEFPKQWNLKEQKDIEINGTDLDFYLDILDVGYDLEEISIPNIGRKPLSVSDNQVNCIFEPLIDDVVFLTFKTEEERIEKVKECNEKRQRYIVVSDDIFKMFATGGHFNSAYNKMRELLYQNTQYYETISLSIRPVYYLEPNTRIYIKDADSGVVGDYMINNFSLPLGQGSMSVSCSKVLERI